MLCRGVPPVCAVMRLRIARMRVRSRVRHHQLRCLRGGKNVPCGRVRYIDAYLHAGRVRNLRRQRVGMLRPSRRWHADVVLHRVGNLVLRADVLRER